MILLSIFNNWHQYLFRDGITTICHAALILSVGFGGIGSISLALLILIPLSFFNDPSLVSYLSNIVWVIPASIFIGIFSAGLMHQSSHSHIPNKILNRIVGELCALHQLIGFYGWQIPHIAHHRDSDVHGKDPHAPGEMSILQYSNRIKKDVLKSLETSYKDTFPIRDADCIWRTTFFLIWTSRILRTLFWYALLGPFYFIFLFVSSYFVQLLFYVHFNWATHKTNERGEVEIRDLDDRLYYKIINVLLWGMFYHGTHHKTPEACNPKIYVQARFLNSI